MDDLQRDVIAEYVCVCVREREREAHGGQGCTLCSVVNLNYFIVIQSLTLITVIY